VLPCDAPDAFWERKHWNLCVHDKRYRFLFGSGGFAYLTVLELVDNAIGAHHYAQEEIYAYLYEMLG
jgi:hypothetical protein